MGVSVNSGKGSCYIKMPCITDFSIDLILIGKLPSLNKVMHLLLGKEDGGKNHVITLGMVILMTRSWL